MTTPAIETTPIEPAGRRPAHWVAGLVETAASLLAIYAIGALLINKAGTVITFGPTAEVVPEEVSIYHLWLGVLSAAVAVSFAAAFWRRRRFGGSARWHTVVLVAGLVSAVVFHVSLDSPAPPVPAQDRSFTACHSGGDSRDCVGG